MCMQYHSGGVEPNNSSKQAKVLRKEVKQGLASGHLNKLDAHVRVKGGRLMKHNQASVMDSD